MRYLISVTIIICLVIPLLAIPVSARPVTAEDARSVSANWVALKIRQQGGWGGSPTAETGEIQEFRQGDRVIGYFCPVRPQGFLVIPLLRELAPVTAYSDTSNLDPDSEEGPAGLIKVQMAGVLDAVSQAGGTVASASSADITPLMEFNYLDSWDVLDSGHFSSGETIPAVVTASAYQQGGVLLTTQWHQSDPYYNEVPAPPPESTCLNSHCTVGCGPLVEGQVMRYWSWPPSRDAAEPYDWTLMADEYLWDSGESRWEDRDGNPLGPENIDAVAGLLAEIGGLEGAEYCRNGCGTYSYFDAMLENLENNFRYNRAGTISYRADYSPTEWFSRIKDQLNLNRPVPYRVREHFIVGDGWREFLVGSDLIREYHMNYGWGDSGANIWYVLEGLLLGGVNEEMMMENIYPAPALGNTLSGPYLPPAIPFRYFDTDAAGDNATFFAGQSLQFLPGVSAGCNRGTGTSVRFEGTRSAPTQLFTGGDLSRGILIRSGTLELKPGGGVRLF